MGVPGIPFLSLWVPLAFGIVLGSIPAFGGDKTSYLPGCWTRPPPSPNLSPPHPKKLTPHPQLTCSKGQFNNGLVQISQHKGFTHTGDAFAAGIVFVIRHGGA